MHYSDLKPETSLISLQNDINRLAKKRKNKIKMLKKKEQQLKLPSVHQVPYDPAKQLMLQRIQYFQNRIGALQRYLDRRQTKYPHSHISLHEHRPLEQSHFYQKNKENRKKIQPSFSIDFRPNQQCLEQSKVRKSQRKSKNNILSSQKSNIKQSSKKSLKPVVHQKKEINKYRLLTKFRVAAFAVYFMIVFPKYSRTITLNRYDYFLINWNQPKSLNSKKKKIVQRYEEIVSQIFKQFQQKNDDEVKELKNEDSKIDDLSSESSSQQSQQEMEKQKPKKEKVVQLFLSIDKATQFIQNLVNRICQQIEQISQDNKQLVQFCEFFLQYRWIPDYLLTQKYSYGLSIHKIKRYNTHNEKTTTYLLTKFVFYDFLVKSGIYKRICQKVLEAMPQDSESREHKFISYFIRNVLLERVIESCLQKIQPAKTQIKSENKSFYPFFLEQSSINRKNESQKQLDLQQQGIVINKQNIQQIVQRQFVKIKKNITQKIQNSIKVFHKKVHQFHIKNVKMIKQQLLNNFKLRNETDEYFNKRSLLQRKKTLVKLSSKFSKLSYSNKQIQKDKKLKKFKKQSILSKNQISIQDSILNQSLNQLSNKLSISSQEKSSLKASVLLSQSQISSQLSNNKAFKKQKKATFIKAS